jgi:hypothetical protein
VSTAIYQIISRAEAKEQGLKYYFTGGICKNNHKAPHHTRSGKCITCNKTIRETYHQNPTLCKKWKVPHYDYEYSRNYRLKNKTQTIERARIWRKTHRSNCNASSKPCIKRWNKRNPAKRALYNLIRKRYVTRAIPTWYEEHNIKQLYLKRDELSLLWNTVLHIDHIIPINPRDNSVCGLHCWSNLQLLPQDLNCSKGDKYEVDW